MKEELKVELKKDSVINFENVSLEDVVEIEEVVTAAWGTVDCCPNS